MTTTSAGTPLISQDDLDSLLAKQASGLTAVDIEKLIVAAVDAGVLQMNMRRCRVVFTGTCSLSRTKMNALVKACGGRVADTSAQANLLVYGNTGVHGVTTKIRDARARGITTLNEQEFVAILLQGAAL